MNFAKFVTTPFLEKITARLVPIITISIVVKGKLGNETVNYDINLKHNNLSQKYKLSKSAVQTKEKF